jgi:hypothetical protein
MTRFLLLMILVFYIPIESYSCNIKKILTQSELDSLSKGFEIYVEADNIKLMKNMTGTLRIKSHKKKLIYCEIGEWKEYYKGTKNIRALTIYDSLGCIQIYKQFTESEYNEYDCDYIKKQFNNETYLIETIKYYYENGQLCETGQRVRKIGLKNGYTSYLKHFRKTGLWTRYDYNGIMISMKDHGEIEKK